MAYDLATVTNSGNQLLASVVSDKSSLVIDKIEVSNTQLASSTDLKSMTSISNVVQTLSANGYQKKDNSFIISTVLDNSSVTADYKAWVFGIWAHETDGGSPILMSVITSTSSPDTISKGSGTPIDYNYKFITTFSNTSSLTIQMASDTYATNDTVIHNSGDETATGTKTFQEIKISNDKFPSLVQTDGQYITLDGGNTEIVPADNSKVVHTTGDETINGQKKFDTDPTDSAGNSYAKTIDVNQQLDKKVNVADMRKPASDVAGIEEVNAKQDKIGYTPADDSKVAHLSGANNFDTVPTVNNNPLLLASSLPSDLARTGSDQEFTGKNTFDTAPIDKTTGNPYITKDGVPSDVVRTGQPQTFTAAQTFSIAPVINDASTDKGDNQAATMADLKSVEKSAWRQLDCSSYTSPLYKGLILYKIDEANKQIYFKTISQSVFSKNGEQIVNANSSIVDFSAVVNKILSVNCLVVSAEHSSGSGSNYSYSSVLNASGSVLINKSQFLGHPDSIFAVLPNTGDSIPYVTYDSLVNI